MSVEEQVAPKKLSGRQSLDFFQRIVSTVRPLYPKLGLCVLGAMSTAVVETLLPQLVAYGVDHYMRAGVLSESARCEGVAELGMVYSLMLLYSAAATYGISYNLNQIGQSAVLVLRRQVFAHLHRLPMTYFDGNPVGRLVTRVANDTGTLSELFTGVLANLLSDILKFFLIWIMLIAISPGLTFALLLMVPPLLWSSLWFRRENSQVQRNIRVQLARLNAFLQENLQGIPIIKSFTAEPEMSRRFEERNRVYFNIELRMVKLYAVFRPVFATASMVALALIVVYGGWLVGEKRLTLGDFIAFIFYLRMLFAPLDDLAEKFNIFQSATVASERIFDILDTPMEPQGPPCQDSTFRARGEIVFENVHFAYTPEKPVLRGVSFTVKPGQSVALVGATGSGKTTVTGLLMRFYQLENGGDGRILVDGKPIQEWNVDELRAQFGLVQQDLFLFRASLGDNIRLHREVAEDGMDQALRVSQSAQVVAKYPDGLDQQLGERGQQLSQGERQLLSFARALINDPPMMILDEATASIDSVTEQQIQNALAHVLKDRTALVVAHRLSTIRQCDQILVFDHGQVLENGTHDQLLALGGHYADLYRSQLLA